MTCMANFGQYLIKFLSDYQELGSPELFSTNEEINAVNAVNAVPGNKKLKIHRLVPFVIFIQLLTQ